MSRKSKRPTAGPRKQPPRRPQPRPQVAGVPPTLGAVVEEAVSGESYAAAGNVASGAEGLSASPPATRRRVERLDAVTAGGRPRQRAVRPGSQAAIFEPLPPGDAAIPFDRVPYVPDDLRRVAIMAGAMVALIIVAAIVVTVLVK